MIERQDNAIDPRLRAFLMAVRAALIALIGAIEKLLDIKEEKRVANRRADVIKSPRP